MAEYESAVSDVVGILKTIPGPLPQKERINCIIARESKHVITSCYAARMCTAGVHFFVKIEIRSLLSIDRFCVSFFLDPKMDYESEESAL